MRSGWISYIETASCRVPFQYKDGLSRYGDLSLTWDHYIGETVSLYSDGPLVYYVFGDYFYQIMAHRCIQAALQYGICMQGK